MQWYFYDLFVTNPHTWICTIFVNFLFMGHSWKDQFQLHTYLFLLLQWCQVSPNCFHLFWVFYQIWFNFVDESTKKDQFSTSHMIISPVAAPPCFSQLFFTYSEFLPDFGWILLMRLKDQFLTLHILISPVAVSPCFSWLFFLPPTLSWSFYQFGLSFVDEIIDHFSTLHILISPMSMMPCFPQSFSPILSFFHRFGWILLMSQQ